MSFFVPVFFILAFLAVAGFGVRCWLLDCEDEDRRLKRGRWKE